MIGQALQCGTHLQRHPVIAAACVLQLDQRGFHFAACADQIIARRETFAVNRERLGMAPAVRRIVGGAQFEGVIRCRAAAGYIVLRQGDTRLRQQCIGEALSIDRL